MSVFEPTSKVGQMPNQNDEFYWVENEDAAIQLDKPNQVIKVVWFYVLLSLIACLLCGRLFQLQVTQGKSHQILAQGNRIRAREILPPRGIITDRFGITLAKNIASFSLAIVPADLPTDRSERQQIYIQAADLIQSNVEKIQKQVEANGLRSINPIILQENIDQQVALQYMVKIGNRPGLLVLEQPIREYLLAPGLAHLLGYTGKVSEGELKQSARYSYSSRVGKTGIERAYESQLYGLPGIERVEVNSKGYFQRVVGDQKPISGSTIKLTLDIELQKYLGNALMTKLSEVQSNAGVGIAMDPRDGSILAMVSLPDYNNNDFARGIGTDRLAELTSNPTSPLTNRAIGGVYPPGSVIKPVVASAGLTEKVISEKTTLDIPAQIQIGEYVFPDWKAHGLTDVRKAIAVSSDIFFYAVGGGWDKVSGLGIDRLDRYLELFGLGKTTGIDLSGEVEGLVPSPEWKQELKHEAWYTGDTYHLSIGQGDLLTTPLQVLNTVATIANHGTISTPHLLLQDQPVVGGQSEVLPPTAVAENIIDDKWLSIVRLGMKQSVENGSSRQLQELPVSSAGKTGTAQFGNEDKTHAWFTAFAPYENPEIAIIILVEGGGDGNVVAEPIANDVLKWYFGDHHSQYNNR